MVEAAFKTAARDDIIAPNSAAITKPKSFTAERCQYAFTQSFFSHLWNTHPNSI